MHGLDIDPVALGKRDAPDLIARQQRLRFIALEDAHDRLAMSCHGVMACKKVSAWWLRPSRPVT